VNTIRVGRLNLKYRGVPSGVAQSALVEFPSTLTRHLLQHGERKESAASSSATIRIAPHSTAPAIAEAVAAHVASTVRARIASGARQRKA